MGRSVGGTPAPRLPNIGIGRDGRRAHGRRIDFSSADHKVRVMGWLVLAGLTAVACASALSLACATGPGERRSLVVSRAAVAFHAIAIGPPYALALVNRLTRTNMVLSVLLAAFIGGALAARYAGGAAALKGQLADALAGFRRAPADLRRACRLAGYPLWPAVVSAIALLGWMGFCVLVSPPRGNSDAFYYHEPIVAFLIQNEGLASIPLPDNLQRINGMPRFCHFIQLWFAMFTGRPLVELPNVLAHPVAIASIYAMCRQAGVQKSAALGWAFCFTLTPGVLRLTDVIMVDVHTAALMLAACALVVCLPMTVANALFMATGTALLCGTKFHALALVAILSIILGGRTLAMRGRWTNGRILAVVLATASIVLAAAASVLLRNYVLFENAFHPFGFQSDLLDIHWGKHNSFFSGKAITPGGVWDKWFAAPFSVKAWTNPSARVEDYGLAAVFVSIPLGLLAPFWAAYRARGLRVADRSIPPSLRAALLVGLIWLVGYGTFPAIVRGRYYLGLIGLTFVLAAWLFSAPRQRPIGRQMAFATQMMMIISVVWSMHHGWVTEPTRIWKRISAPVAEWDYTARMLMSVTPEVGRARTAELHDEMKVGFFQGKLIGVFWNDDYSNDVVWLGNRKDLARAERENIDWLYMHTARVERVKGAEKDDWERIGPVMTGRKGVPPGMMYRRKDSAAAAAGAPVYVSKKKAKAKKKKPKAKKKKPKAKAKKPQPKPNAPPEPSAPKSAPVAPGNDRPASVAPATKPTAARPNPRGAP